MNKKVTGGGEYNSLRRVTLFLFIILLMIIGISFSYSKAYFKKQVEVADTTLKVGTLEYTMTMDGSTNNRVSIESHKYLFLDVVVTSKNPINSKFSLVYQATPSNLSENSYEVQYFENQDIPYGIIKANETKRIRLRIYNNSNDTINLTFQVKSSLINNDIELLTEEKEIKRIVDTDYKENVLNGTDPILSDNLVPVIIEDNGTVRRSSLKEEWYNYSNQRWANAVVLESKTSYSDGQVIPEENIQSYFVWIPRYKYKLFDMGNYSSLTSITDATKTIEVVFENKNTTPVVGTKVGDYHSHPVFQAFNSNGFWVGKFESGYKGATSTAAAEQNIADSTKLIIKPNVYSWRNITVGNAFKVSYDYMRSEESHMMKNTEWGAVAYLQHSVYGSRASVRVNNNSSYLTGYASVTEPTLGYNNGTSIEGNLVGTDVSITQPYNTEVGYTASTTGNITGVYDMSGGAWEYVMGYNVNTSKVGGDSEITSLYSDFFTNSKWNKYYDKYYNTTSIQAYNKRILGDATGEIGPFADVASPTGQTFYNSSWYNDYGYFIESSAPWFERGGGWYFGSIAGIFSFSNAVGTIDDHYTFRIILTLLN